MSGHTKAAIVAVLIVGTNALGGCVAAPFLLANELMVRMDNETAGWRFDGKPSAGTGTLSP